MSLRFQISVFFSQLFNGSVKIYVFTVVPFLRENYYNYSDVEITFIVIKSNNFLIWVQTSLLDDLKLVFPSLTKCNFLHHFAQW